MLCVSFYILNSPPLMHLLQLAVQFLSMSASPQNCWTLLGIGIRIIQDVGVHRKRPRSWSPAQDESWKRGFWYAQLDRYTLRCLFLNLLLGCFMFWIGYSVLHWVGPVQFRRKSLYLHSNPTSSSLMDS